jgi:RHS repeat-associated protein
VNSSFGYDAESRVTNYTHGSFISRSIIRGPRGFKTHENIAAGLSPSISEGEQKMVHNDADQLTKITQRDSWLGGELNQWYDRNYTYDNNGCLTQENVSRPSWNTNTAIAEYTTGYGWDYDSRLVSVTGGSSSTSTAYLYDAGGSRVGRIANGVTNYFVIDYNAPLKMPLAETDAEGNITRYYIWSSHGLLAHLDVNPSTGAITATRYYHADEQGSTLALTDENGAVTDQFAYTPYGKCTARTGTTQTPFQWLGGIAVQHEGDGLYYMLNRYYSADMKRFIQQDPSGIDGGVNLYSYAGLNPNAYSDPFGLERTSIGRKALSFGQNALNAIGSVLSFPDRAIEKITGLDEYERFNIAVNTPIPHDDMLVGGLAMITKSGAFLSALKFADKVEDAMPELRISSSKYPDLAENITHAQNAGHPSILTHGGNSAVNRAAALGEVPNLRSLSRDEYPFASSMEGGGGSWVGHIPLNQQQAQGGLIRAMNLKAGDQYRVKVTP